MNVFLSASIPAPGREYRDTANIYAIREAVMSLVKVCISNDVSLYFGGHPSITPIIYDVVRDIKLDFLQNIKIYQSAYFKDQTPIEVNYYPNIIWTKKEDSMIESVNRMRDIMLDQPTDVAVFIGGMNGIIQEAKIVFQKHPDVHLVAVTNVGCASSDIEKETGLCVQAIGDTFAYTKRFNAILTSINNCHE